MEKIAAPGRPALDRLDFARPATAAVEPSLNANVSQGPDHVLLRFQFRFRTNFLRFDSEGCLVRVRMTVKPGGFDDASQGWTGGYATRNDNTGSVYLNCEFVVMEGSMRAARCGRSSACTARRARVVEHGAHLYQGGSQFGTRHPSQR